MIARAKRVAILPSRLYHYVQWEGSILHHSVTRKRAHVVWLKALAERCRYARKSPLLSRKERSFFYIYSVKRLLMEWKSYRKMLQELPQESPDVEMYRLYKHESSEAMRRLYGLPLSPFTYRLIRFHLFFYRHLVKHVLC